MKNQLQYDAPFWIWGGHGFYNSYASVYMYMQKQNGCAVALNRPEDFAENLNNLFETMAGQTIMRSSWSGEPTAIQKELEVRFGDGSNATDRLVDFIVGFTGYEYKKITTELKQAVMDSINAGKPVIAKLKADDWQSELGKGYRVIIGYDEDALLEPGYVYESSAAPAKPVTYDQMECIYLFGEKTAQKYTMLDVLKQMEEIMNSDFAQGIWVDFAYHFDFEHGDWGKTAGEVKQRFERLEDMGWNLSCMGHSLQNATGDRELLQSLGLNIKQHDELISTLGEQTHLLHNLGYQANALRSSALSFQLTDQQEWPWDLHGLITSAAMVIDAVMECEKKILLAIKKAIRKFQ